MCNHTWLWRNIQKHLSFPQAQKSCSETWVPSPYLLIRKQKAKLVPLHGCLVIPKPPPDLPSPSFILFLRCNPPSLGKTMRYSALHCGQATRAVLLPRCFSSTQRCRQDWWTHLVEPRQRHGRTHSAVRSSSSVAKHTQQLLKTNTHTHSWDEDDETHTHPDNWKRVVAFEMNISGSYITSHFCTYFPQITTKQLC